MYNSENFSYNKKSFRIIKLKVTLFRLMFKNSKTVSNLKEWQKCSEFKVTLASEG